LRHVLFKKKILKRKEEKKFSRSKDALFGRLLRSRNSQEVKMLYLESFCDN
jgi:hypothetical protein